MGLGLPRSAEGAHMPDEGIARERARAAIQAGKIPLRRPDRTWGGPGVGAQCAVCDLPITRDQLELEIEFVRLGGLDNLHVHIRCFAAWELERTKPSVASPPTQ
jgi:hypothetical protein